MSEETTPTTSGLHSEVSLLRHEVHALKEEVKAKRDGVVGRAERWGKVLAFVAGVIALPGGIIGTAKVVRSLFTAPETRVFKAPQPLDISFNPDSSRLSFAFPFTIANQGVEHDRIDEIRLELAESTGEIPLRLGLPDVRLTEGDAKMPLPLPVKSDDIRSLRMQVDADVGNAELARLTQPGPWVLRVLLLGQEPEALEFCFHMGPNVVEHTFRSSPYHRRLHSHDCPPA